MLSSDKWMALTPDGKKIEDNKNALILLLEDEENFAIAKCVYKNSKNSKINFEMERDVLSKIRHQNIIRYFGCEENSDQYFIFLEYAEGGDLLGLLQERCLTPKECSRVIRKVVRAVAYLHRNNIIHMDVKCDNVLLGTKIDPFSVVKLADFGLSKKCVLGEKLPKQFLGGSAWYSAPEVLRQESGVSHACDVWSIGVCAYCCLVGSFPFGSSEEDDLMFLISSVLNDIERSTVSRLSIMRDGDERKFIENCFRIVPGERPTSMELKEYSWVRKRGSSRGRNRD